MRSQADCCQQAQDGENPQMPAKPSEKECLTFQQGFEQGIALTGYD